MNGAPPTASFGIRILGSFLSALVGWMALIIYNQLTVRPNPNISLGDMIGEFWAGVGMIDYLASVLMFGIWIVAILPLYLLIPKNSRFWRWPLCTICGAIGGAFIMLIISRTVLSLNEPWADFVRPSIVVAGVGWITCLFASLTRRYFQYSNKKE